jgi:hypothetical protein
MKTYKKDWDTNGIEAHTTGKGVVVENWNINQGCVSGSKILIIGGSLPTEADLETYFERIKNPEMFPNVRILRKGHIVR